MMALVRSLSVLLLLFTLPVNAETDYSHYAFANYLGSGIYRTSGQNATVVNIPISFDLERTETESLVLRTPLSLGFFNRVAVLSVPLLRVVHPLLTFVLIVRPLPQQLIDEACVRPWVPCSPYCPSFTPVNCECLLLTSVLIFRVVHPLHP